MWGLRWRTWASRVATAEVRTERCTCETRTKTLTSSAHCAVQVEFATGREVVKQGTPLLRNRLRPGEVLLWVGCSGITKSREQVQHESFWNPHTLFRTMLMCLFLVFILVVNSGT